MSEFDFMPITIVAYEYDKSSSLCYQYGIGLVVAIIDCDFSDYEQVYRERIAPMSDMGMGRTVMIHIYRRFPGPGAFPRNTLVAPKDEKAFEMDIQVTSTNPYGEIDLEPRKQEKRDTSYDDLF